MKKERQVTLQAKSEFKDCKLDVTRAKDEIFVVGEKRAIEFLQSGFVDLLKIEKLVQ